MADLGRSLRGDDRGQIILIAAFIIAVSFVVLAVVVNSAIFTENLSTRDDVAGSQDALKYRAELKGAVGNVVESVNENASLSQSDVEASVQNMSTHSGLSQSRLGRIVNMSVTTWQSGQRIAQDNASRNFTSNDSAVLSPDDWTLAGNVDQTRNFQLNITNPSAVTSFQVIANESGGLVDPHQWEMTVGESGGDFLVTVERRGGLLGADTITATCDRSSFGSHVTIDITDATVAGEPCHALYRLQPSGDRLWFGAEFGSDEYDIEFENGDQVEGTYSLVVDDGASIPGSNFHGSQNDDFPYAQTSGIIWSTTLKYSYLTSALAYQTEIEVIPGELPP